MAEILRAGTKSSRPPIFTTETDDRRVRAAVHARDEVLHTPERSPVLASTSGRLMMPERWIELSGHGGRSSATPRAAGGGGQGGRASPPSGGRRGRGPRRAAWRRGRRPPSSRRTCPLAARCTSLAQRSFERCWETAVGEAPTRSARHETEDSPCSKAHRSLIRVGSESRRKASTGRGDPLLRAASRGPAYLRACEGNDTLPWDGRGARPTVTVATDSRLSSECHSPMVLARLVARSGRPIRSRLGGTGVDQNHAVARHPLNTAR